MARAKKPAALSEAALIVLLKERFGAPEYAFLPHVRNGTGYTRRVTRTADALAFGLWPSRGLDLHGFEIKSDRQDWLHEKETPEKAEEIARFCDRWWLVVGAEDIVQPGELPPAWGLIVPRGEKLVVKVEAAKLEAKPLDRAQLAAILRRAAECVVPRAEIDAELELARKAGEDLATKQAAWTHAHEARELAELQRRVAEFEAASGVEIDRWRGARSIGEAVRFVLDGGLKREERRLRDLHGTAKEIFEALEQRIAALPKTGTEAA
jgi:hypothetical protein